MASGHGVDKPRRENDPNRKVARPAPREDDHDDEWEYDRESGKAVRPSTPKPLPGAYR